MCETRALLDRKIRNPPSCAPATGALAQVRLRISRTLLIAKQKKKGQGDAMHAKSKNENTCHDIVFVEGIFVCFTPLLDPISFERSQRKQCRCTKKHIAHRPTVNGVLCPNARFQLGARFVKVSFSECAVNKLPRFPKISCTCTLRFKIPENNADIIICTRIHGFAHTHRTHTHR